jgi:hypothetical protein
MRRAVSACCASSAMLVVTLPFRRSSARACFCCCSAAADLMASMAVAAPRVDVARRRRVRATPSSAALRARARHHTPGAGVSGRGGQVLPSCGLRAVIIYSAVAHQRQVCRGGNGGEAAAQPTRSDPWLRLHRWSWLLGRRA